MIIDRCHGLWGEQDTRVACHRDQSVTLGGLSGAVTAGSLGVYAGVDPGVGIGVGLDTDPRTDPLDPLSMQANRRTSAGAARSDRPFCGVSPGGDAYA